MPNYDRLRQLRLAYSGDETDFDIAKIILWRILVSQATSTQTTAIGIWRLDHHGKAGRVEAIQQWFEKLDFISRISIEARGSQNQLELDIRV